MRPLLTMNINTLLSLIEMRGLKPSEVARRAGVSRQTLSLWKKKANTAQAANINVYSHTQDKLAAVLCVKSAVLSKTIRVIDTASERSAIEADLLWDKLFKNIESFAAAVVRGQPAALARLVQMYGLFSAAKIAGGQIWKKFPQYKKLIHPASRRQAEVLWMLVQNQT